MATAPTAHHTVFILDLERPWRPIREAEAGIIVCGKTTWASAPISKLGGRIRRHLLGSSAFYTHKAAARAKLGALRKIAGDGYLKYHVPHAWNSAVTQLAAFEKDGTVH